MDSTLQYLIHKRKEAIKIGDTRESKNLLREIIAWQESCRHEPKLKNGVPHMIRICQPIKNEHYRVGGALNICRHCNIVLYYQWPESPPPPLSRFERLRDAL